MLSIKGLQVAFGGVSVLHGIDLDVQAGQLTAVVGANGAGKTTLLRAVSRLAPAKAGSIHFDGQDLAALAPHLVARRGLVHVPQGRQIVPGLSVEQNLLLGASSLPGMDDATQQQLLAAEYARFPVLAQRRHIPGEALSGGEQQMLAVSRALMMRPRLLILDEPSLGLAPQIVRSIHASLRELATQGMAVLLVEQVAFAALRIADHGYVIQNGRIAMAGPPEQLLRDPALVQRYLS
ncbi:MAG TPA: ABC transporter ATP-binding protein [Pseudorhodoferax sp.]|nr:ABC transporter ATP-binding protein [Pseudorhodoferax sp.]